MDVRMPDGTIVKNVPKGTTQSELLGRLGNGSAADVFGRGAVDALANPLLNIPNALVTGAANIPSPANLVSPLLGQGFRDETLFEDITGATPPALGARVLPTPRMEDIRQFFGGPTVEEQQAQAAEFPTADLLGNMLGTGATLALGRMPSAPARLRAAPATPAATQLPFGTRRLFNNAFKSKAVGTLANAAKKSTEAGIEGSVIAILNEGDPAEVAGLSVATQAVGSGALQLLPKSWKGGVGFFMAGMGMATAIQLAKSVTPGGDDDFGASVASSFQKMSWGLIAGLTAAGMGQGRLGRKFGKEFARNVPRFADALTAVPRGAVIGLINEATKDDRIEAVVNQMVSQPDFFAEGEFRSLGRALRSSKLSVTDTLNRLSRDEAFRQKIEQLRSGPQ